MAGARAAGRRPLFHGDRYLDAVPGLRAEGVNPLIHYVERGADAGIAPNPLFDPDWYAQRYLGGAEPAPGRSSTS